MPRTLSMPQEVHALLAYGTSLRIRPARPGDREQVLRLYQGLSMESLRFRFFGPSRRLTELAAAKVCSPPRDGCLALVADSGGQIVGISEYDTAVDRSRDPACAETAVAVADDWHGRGVGTLLVEHLVGAAWAAGVCRFTADVLAENRAVLRMFHDRGLPVSYRPEGTEVHCTVSLGQCEDYTSAVEARRRIADVACVRSLPRPLSIVLIGAGRRPGSVGRAVLDDLRDGGFIGTLCVVDPRAERNGEVPCRVTVASLLDGLGWVSPCPRSSLTATRRRTAKGNKRRTRRSGR